MSVQYLIDLQSVWDYWRSKYIMMVLTMLNLTHGYKTSRLLLYYCCCIESIRVLTIIIIGFGDIGQMKIEIRLIDNWILLNIMILSDNDNWIRLSNVFLYWIMILIIIINNRRIAFNFLIITRAIWQRLLDSYS